MISFDLLDCSQNAAKWRKTVKFFIAPGNRKGVNILSIWIWPEGAVGIKLLIQTRGK